MKRTVAHPTRSAAARTAGGSERPARDGSSRAAPGGSAPDGARRPARNSSARPARNAAARPIAKPARFPLRAAAALFIQRQHLDRPRGRRLTAANLVRFTRDAGGIQLDSINVVDRAHYLTAWSRFDAFSHAAFDRMAWRKRVLFEYWAHAACMVPRSDLPAWRRAMLDFELRHTGWARWLRKNQRVLDGVEAEIRARGPMANADFRERRPARGVGWWNWKPATHALHWLWMTGRTLVHSRVHFQKRFDLAQRVLEEFDRVEPLTREQFAAWHLRRSLHAMGAATETDLNMYLTFPRTRAVERRRTLQSLLGSGEVVEVEIAGHRGRWFALAEDLKSLAAAARRRRAARGTTLLAPFDSLLWHRDRVKRLFGFDYRIEVYTPGHKRVHGYYSLPIFHDGVLIGRADAKTHRAARRLEVKVVHFEPWFAAGEPPPAASWGALDRAEAVAGVGAALRSLATFVGAGSIALGRVESSRLRAPLARALD